jgi:transmembrane sensor
MDDQRINKLADKWLKGTITDLELKELEDWFAQDDSAPLEVPTDADENSLQYRMYSKIAERGNLQSAKRKNIRRLWPRIAAAASILLVLSASGYFLFHKPQPAVQLAHNDVAPFTQQAILKTGHGKILVLDSNRKGTLAQYANTQIQQSGKAQIAYTNSDAPEELAVFDTLQVPAGGQPYHLKLADGSQVIVNVASALRFPENFRKNHNELELINGEALFSIVHDVNRMLIVKAKDQIIKDYGTEFNVNTYTDEPDRRTTLVEGSVKVNSALLIPGEQAVMNGNSLTITKANIGQTIAWIKGDFVFNGEHIQQVMRELARWYNIEVKYEGKPTEVGFYLKIARSKNISEVLNALERTKNVHFKIEGRRVTVLSKK